MSTEPASGDTNKLFAALAYPTLGVVALIIILTDMKKNPFTRHHGWTGLFWNIAWFVVLIGVSIVSRIPFLLWLGFLTEWLLQLVYFVASVYYAYQAFNGKDVTIPIVSDWVKKYSASAP